MDWFELLRESKEAITTVWSDVCKNWFAFLTIFLIHTLLVVVFTSCWYKRAIANVKYDRELLNKQKEKYEKLEADYKKYKAEIDSPQYQAYLAARQIGNNDLSDADMFTRKKKR